MGKPLKPGGEPEVIFADTEASTEGVEVRLVEIDGSKEGGTEVIFAETDAIKEGIEVGKKAAVTLREMLAERGDVVVLLPMQSTLTYSM